MKKLLTERFQELAGIKPLYQMEEGPADNLELKNLAKKLFLGFKQMGANVQLATNTATLNKAKTVAQNQDKDGNFGSDMKDVWISYGDDGTVHINLIGDKAIGFEDKIKADFPQFEFASFDGGDSWGGKTTKSLRVSAGATTSENRF